MSRNNVYSYRKLFPSSLMRQLIACIDNLTLRKNCFWEQNKYFSARWRWVGNELSRHLIYSLWINICLNIFWLKLMISIHTFGTLNHPSFDCKWLHHYIPVYLRLFHKRKIQNLHFYTIQHKYIFHIKNIIISICTNMSVSIHLILHYRFVSNIAAMKVLNEA